MQINHQNRSDIHNFIVERFTKERFIRVLQPIEQELFLEYISYESKLLRASQISARLERVKDIAQKNKVFWIYLIKPVRLRVSHIIEKLNAQKEEQEWENTKQEVFLKKTGIHDRMKIERMLPVIEIGWIYYAVSLWRVAERFIKLIAWDAVILSVEQLEEIIALQEAQNRQPFKSPWRNSRNPLKWDFPRRQKSGERTSYSDNNTDNTNAWFDSPYYQDSQGGTVNPSPTFTGGGGEYGWWWASGSWE